MAGFGRNELVQVDPFTRYMHRDDLSAAVGQHLRPPDNSGNNREAVRRFSPLVCERLAWREVANRMGQGKHRGPVLVSEGAILFEFSQKRLQNRC